MDLDTFIRVTYVIIAVVSVLSAGMGLLIKKFITNPINVLEEKSVNYVTKEELRQALADKVEPLKDDMAEIKQQLAKIYELLIK